MKGILYVFFHRFFNEYTHCCFSCKAKTNNTVNKQIGKLTMKVNYEESCKKASFIGYESKPDPDAYNGVAYINKDGKIWIHDIEALKLKLGVKDKELEALNYNTEDYYKYERISFEKIKALASQEEMLEIFGDLIFEEISPCGMGYISDGVYISQSGDLIDK